MLLMIACGSKGKTEKNTELIDAIKSAKYWWNYIPNVWIISTNEDVDYWINKLKENNPNDTSFLIVDITESERQGWLPSKAWDWLNENSQ